MPSTVASSRFWRTAPPVRRIEGRAAARRVVKRERRARLERHRGDAADVMREAHHLVGGGKRALGRLLVAEKGLDREIPRQLVPHRWRAGRKRGRRVEDEGQRLVFDRDRLGCVERLRQRLGHHHRHRLADMARLVPRQERVRAR